MELKHLSQEIVGAIKKFIEKNFKGAELQKDFPNKLLREDALSLLDKYCTVIYYPLEGERNNGFHITEVPSKTGDKSFVFINTAQTIEKQVFSAAHELGHILKVDDYVVAECSPASIGDISREQIINRFAAELLMPEDTFNHYFDAETEKYKNEDGKITVANMLKVVVALMNQFFTPAKSIIYRCVETERISVNDGKVLLGDSGTSWELIENKINEIIQENAYIQFRQPNNKKLIVGLAELLEQAEKQEAVSAEKIKKLRNDFDLPSESVEDTALNETLG